MSHDDEAWAPDCWDESEESEQSERLRAAVALAHDEPAVGIPRLLALIVDFDLDEGDEVLRRAEALHSLMATGASAYKAGMWLLAHAPGANEMGRILSAADVATAPPQARPDEPQDGKGQAQQALAYLISAADLPEHLRWQAMDELLRADRAAYHSLRHLAPDIDFAAAVAGYADTSDSDHVHYIASCFARDCQESLAQRLAAAAWLCQEESAYAGDAMFAVLGESPAAEGGMEVLLEVLVQADRPQWDCFQKSVLGDDLSRAAETGLRLKALLEATDAVHDLNPGGAHLLDLHHRVRSRLESSWGPGGTMNAWLADPGGILQLTKTVARYDSIRAEYTRWWTNLSLRTDGETSAARDWSFLELSPEQLMMYRIEGSEWLWLTLDPTGSSEIIMWELVVDARESGNSTRVRGECIMRLGKPYLGFEEPGQQQSRWVAQLLDGIPRLAAWAQAVER